MTHQLYRVAVDGVTEWTGHDSEHAYEVFRSFATTRSESIVELFNTSASAYGVREALYAPVKAVA